MKNFKTFANARIKALMGALVVAGVLASCAASSPAYASTKEQTCYKAVSVALQTQELLLAKPEALKALEELIAADKGLSTTSKQQMLERIYFVENRKTLPPETLKTLVFLRCIGDLT